VPALLKLGYHPRVASATSAFDYMFIGLTNLITLFLKRSLPIEVTLWFGGLAFIGGIFVTRAGYYIIEKYKIAFVVVFIVLALALLNFIAGIWYISTQSERFGFNSLIDFKNKC
jgi:uncharacterized membrane protein YfcA